MFVCICMYRFLCTMYRKYVYIHVCVSTYREITVILVVQVPILGTPYLRFCKTVFAQIDYLMHLER